MSLPITLNCDLGETDNVLSTGAEHMAMPYIDLANIACGFHAGNRQTMQDTITLAKQHNVQIGAHPSYPDRENFGRVSMALNQADVCDAVYQQISLLDALCDDQNTELKYVKPHGALYHDLLHNEAIRHGVFQAVAELNTALPIMVLAEFNQTALQKSADYFGVSLWYEAFADRRYLGNGLLQSRSEAGAVLTDEAKIIAQAKAIAKGHAITTADNTDLVIQAHSLCVHGDNPEAVNLIKTIRQAIVQ